MPSPPWETTVCLVYDEQREQRQQRPRQQQGYNTDELTVVLLGAETSSTPLHPLDEEIGLPVSDPGKV
eukprot:12426478-Karenia_brevis.AAC.1